MMLFAPATVPGAQGYSGEALWNNLPTNLKQAQTLASLKSGCRVFFWIMNTFSYCYYFSCY